jgi:hypothetical protein
MTTRDAGLTKEQVEAAEVHAAGSSHCGEIKSKSAFSRHSTLLLLQGLLLFFFLSSLSRCCSLCCSAL